MDSGDLVDIGQAHIDIEDVGTLLLLGDALAHDVIEVARAQRFLEAFLAGGVDALANYGDAVPANG